MDAPTFGSFRQTRSGRKCAGIAIVVTTFLAIIAEKYLYNDIVVDILVEKTKEPLNIMLNNNSLPHEDIDIEDINATNIWTDLCDKAQLRSKVVQQQATSSSLARTLNQLKGDDISRLSIEDVFSIFPPPVKSQTIQIYNQASYKELIELFVSTSTTNNRTITICANGGSATAGGGAIWAVHRYFNHLARYLRGITRATNRGKQAFQTVDRGHGHRHSLHSAIFSSSFLPPNIDLLLWEFAINDYGYSIDDEGTRMQQQRSIFLAWLKEVEKIQPRPPKVILVYLWKYPFQWDENRQVINPVFTSHAELAKEFDFVIGHVNLASYIDELDLPSFKVAQRTFLADNLHPNKVGHLAMSFLLLDLLRGKGEWTRSYTLPQLAVQQKDEAQDYNWYCGNETSEKRFLQSRIVAQGDDDSSFPGWRAPLGALTMEQPKNKEGSRPRQLIISNAPKQAITTLGKQDPLRKDRQKSISLPCCSTTTNATLTIKLSSTTDPPMEGVQAIFLGFGTTIPDISNLDIYINFEKHPTSGELLQVVPDDWPCFWSFDGLYKPYWFVLSKERSNVSKIGLCVKNNRCERNRSSDALLMTLAVY